MTGNQETWWKSLRRIASLQPLACGAGLFLALYYFAPNHWVHFAWMAVWAAWVIWNRAAPAASAPLRKETTMWCVGGFLGWMWFGMFHGAAPDGWMRAVAICDALLLGALIMGLWDLAQRPSRLDMVLKWIIGLAALSVFISFIVFYGIVQRTFPLERLRNVFVNFDLATYGQHPVATGLTWTFPALAAAAWASQTNDRGLRRWLLAAFAVLAAGIFFTQTRGAILGLLIGLGVILIFRPIRFAARPVMVAACVFFAYQQSPELLPESGSGPVISSDGMAASDFKNPGKLLIARADSGRLDWYSTLMDRMHGPGEILLGRGFWANDTGTMETASWHWHHPHGAFLSAFYHGGVVGISLIAAALFLAAKRCLWLAHKGLDVRWAALLGGGAAMMVFDGHTLATLTTVPRTEPLVFWAPLIIGTALAAKIRADAPPSRAAESAQA